MPGLLPLLRLRLRSYPVRLRQPLPLDRSSVQVVRLLLLPLSEPVLSIR
jgi:hypothetical protein